MIQCSQRNWYTARIKRSILHASSMLTQWGSSVAVCTAHCVIWSRLQPTRLISLTESLPNLFLLLFLFDILVFPPSLCIKRILFLKGSACFGHLLWHMTRFRCCVTPCVTHFFFYSRGWYPNFGIMHYIFYAKTNDMKSRVKSWQERTTQLSLITALVIIDLWSSLEDPMQVYCGCCMHITTTNIDLGNAPMKREKGWCAQKAISDSLDTRLLLELPYYLLPPPSSKQCISQWARCIYYASRDWFIDITFKKKLIPQWQWAWNDMMLCGSNGEKERAGLIRCTGIHV